MNPQSIYSNFSNDYSGEWKTTKTSHLTLRDIFAIEYLRVHDTRSLSEALARECYSFADKMIRVREEYDNSPPKI